MLLPPRPDDKWLSSRGSGRERGRNRNSEDGVRAQPPEIGCAVRGSKRGVDRKDETTIFESFELSNIAVQGGTSRDDHQWNLFEMSEQPARIRVALRHAAQLSTDAEPTFTSGRFKVDLSARRVVVDDREVHLTPLEYKLLTTLVRYRGILQ